VSDQLQGHLLTAGRTEVVWGARESSTDVSTIAKVDVAPVNLADRRSAAMLAIKRT